MKRLVIITGAVMFLSLAITGGIIPSLEESKENTNIVQETSQSKDKRTSYTIREYNGRIAVFESNEKEPFRTTDMMVSLLPDYDKTLLKNGITVYDKYEVNTILQDYIS